MKFHNRFLSAGLVLLTFATLAVASLDGFSIKRQVKQGQVVKYHLRGEFETEGAQVVFVAIEESKVTNLDADGSYTIQSLQHDAKATFGGQDVDLPENPAVETVYNPDGSVRLVKGDPTVASSGSYRVATMQSVIDPGKTLNVGDTWTIDIKPDPKIGVEATKASYKVLGEEKVGDLDTVKIQTSIKETTGPEPASSEGTVWLSKLDGSIVKAETKWVNMPVPGAPAPITGTMVMTREN